MKTMLRRRSCRARADDDAADAGAALAALNDGSHASSESSHQRHGQGGF
jgi:hypothetical protein